MTVDELVTEVRTGYGFVDTTAAQALVAINAAYWDVCSRNTWPFLRGSTTMAATPGTASLTLPSDFSKVKSIRVPSLRTKIEPVEIDWLVEHYSDLTVTGNPRYYYFDGPTLSIYPTPDAAYVFYMLYSKWPAALAAAAAETTIKIPVRHHEVLILGAALRMMAKDDDTYSTIKALYDEKIAHMVYDLMQQQQDRPQVIYMTADEEWLDPVGW